MGYDKYEFCGYCRYCDCDDLNLSKNGQFPCNREKMWVYADSRPVKSNCFWRVVSYNLVYRDPAIKFSKNYRNFYITTAIYDKLGLDNEYELNKLYLFRHTYLEHSENGKIFLSDYDIFAPRIAKLIALSDTVDARSLYEFYIKGVLKYIERDELFLASELYIAMYERLKEEFIFAPLRNEKEKVYTIRPIERN